MSHSPLYFPKKLALSCCVCATNPGWVDGCNEVNSVRLASSVPCSPTVGLPNRKIRTESPQRCHKIPRNWSLKTTSHQPLPPQCPKLPQITDQTDLSNVPQNQTSASQNHPNTCAFIQSPTIWKTVPFPSATSNPTIVQGQHKYRLFSDVSTHSTSTEWRALCWALLSTGAQDSLCPKGAPGVLSGRPFLWTRALLLCWLTQ